MNIFFLDNDPQIAAQYHCDKHVVKMILESAQILSTVVRANGIDAGYKSTHENHPCTIWAGKCIENFQWVRSLAAELNTEWQLRYNHVNNHKSWNVIRSLPWPNLPSNGNGYITYPAMAMPNYCIVPNDPVQSYRNYYIAEKADMCTWRSPAGQPDWWPE